MAKSKRVRKISSRKSKTSSKAKAAREMRDRACGCGGKTLGYFSMGHDARFKGWLLRIERCERADVLVPRAVFILHWPGD